MVPEYSTLFRFYSALPIGGEGGIRTPDTRKGITVFETAAFNHSATSPIGHAAANRGRNFAVARASAPPSSRFRRPVDG